MIWTMLLACATTLTEPPGVSDSPSESPTRGVSGPFVTNEGLAETPLEEGPEVLVDPDSPQVNDDLWCRLDHADGLDVVSVSWWVDGAPWSGSPSTRTWPGDVVPHLAQSGGQVWWCAMTLSDGATLKAPAVTVAHPVPMVRVPAGTYVLDEEGFVHARDQWVFEPTPFVITRPFWMAETELSRARFMAVAGYDAVDDFIYVVHPTWMALPTSGLSWHEAAWFANRVSELDGLPTCYVCTGSGRDAVCEHQPRAPDCEGYRLPTRIEWLYAYQEAGAHHDLLPAGGQWNAEGRTVVDYYDAEVTGPHAPPKTMISDQCNLGGYSSPYGTTLQVYSFLPNSLGLYNMCSNATEWFTDEPSAVGPFTDDFVGNVPNGRRVGSYAEYNITPGMIIPYRSSSVSESMRLTRTIHTPGGAP